VVYGITDCGMPDIIHLFIVVFVSLHVFVRIQLSELILQEAQLLLYRATRKLD